MKKGYSVVEILVVVGIFAVMAVIATQSVTLSLKSSKKSDSIMLVRNELDYTAGSIERNLQFASAIIIHGCTDLGVDASLPSTPSAGFRDIKGNRGDIACLDMTTGFYTLNNDKRIASSSGETISYKQRLTSPNIDITNCSFSCTKQGEQIYLEFSVEAIGKNAALEENTNPITISKKILVRDVGRR